MALGTKNAERLPILLPYIYIYMCLSENSLEAHLDKGLKTRAAVGVRTVTTKISVQPDRYNPPNLRRVDNSRTQYGVHNFV